jgi:hypothetical protein
MEVINEAIIEENVEMRTKTSQLIIYCKSFKSYQINID